MKDSKSSPEGVRPRGAYVGSLTLLPTVANWVLPNSHTVALKCGTSARILHWTSC